MTPGEPRGQERRYSSAPEPVDERDPVVLELTSSEAHNLLAATEHGLGAVRVGARRTTAEAAIDKLEQALYAQ